METLLLHVPKLEDYYPPFGRYMNVNYMPMGMLALSAHLARSGHPTEVVHAGIEKILDPGWRVADLVSSRGFRAVGLSLHWHYQAYDVARAVERIRSVRPDLFLFAGGITASYFGREMLETIPGLDAVVIGESFEPVRRMLDALERGGTPAGVPNLAWRESGEGREGSIVVNPETLLHPPEFFENLPFADFSAFPRAGRYVAQFGFPLAYSWELTPEENRAMMTMGRTFFPLFTGSGCARSCTYCGGNARTQRRAFHHHRILWRSHRAVLDDIRRALDAGYRTMALCFDPMPESTAWYVELFSRMRRETPEADLYFECWSLPDPEFVRAFADTFSPPHSYLALSPDSGSEQVRRANKGYFYTNDQLFRTADLLKKHGVQMDVFFSIGFPGETVPLALETQGAMRRIADSYPNVRRLMVWAVQLEPGSPMFEQPEHLGIVSSRRSLADFIAVHGSRSDAYSVLGYRVPGFFGDFRDHGGIEEFEKHFQQFKCMEFCFHSRDPRVYSHPGIGRLECLEKRRMLARRQGLPVPESPVGTDVGYADVVAAERPRHPRIEL